MLHTPAPWHVKQYSNRTLTIVAKEPDGSECNPARINGDPDDSVYGLTAWANARLIAAAPELLEACELARTAFTHIPIPADEESEAFNDLWIARDKLVSSIAKATMTPA